jgi:hypothetical protein
MPESFIQLPPNSTGPKARTYRRGADAADPHDAFVIPVSDRVVSNRGLFSSFRMVGRVGTSRPMFSISLAAGSSIMVAVRRLVVQTDSTAARTAVMMQYKTYRASTANISNGTVLTKGQFDTTDEPSADVVCRGDASADGTNSASALTFSAVGTLLWQQFSHRMHTLAGESLSVDNPLLPSIADDTPVILRPGEALVVRMEAGANDAASDHYWVNCAWEEFQRP